MRTCQFIHNLKADMLKMKGYQCAIKTLYVEISCKTIRHSLTEINNFISIDIDVPSSIENIYV